MSGSSRPSLTISLLEKYFTTVKDLRTYLTGILQHQNEGLDKKYAFLPDDSDSTQYRDLIITSYVALKATASQENRTLRFKAFPPMADMREIIDKAQEKLFKTRGSQNVITAGYRLVSKDGDRGRKGMSRIGITNYYVNTIITALQAPEWECLLQRIGVDAMIHLLSETYIFVSLPNECLCQMTGEPMIFMATPFSRQQTTGPPNNSHVQTKEKRKFPYPHDHKPERPAKRSKLSPSTLNFSTGSTTVKFSEFSPADISLVRARLFYARPTRVPLTNDIVVGLPPKHILNMLNPSYQRKPNVKPGTYVEPDPRKQAQDTRHLAKYVFPRQHGLSSPFRTMLPKRDTLKFPDYSDREAEIKAKGSCKTPKRLKETLCILEKMIWRHGKCGYKPLRDKACPSKLTASLDSSIILELMSEYSTQPRSQASIGAGDISVDSVCQSTAPGLSQAKPPAKKPAPRFVEFACSHVEVYRYASLVTKAAIPKAFWGCDANFDLILSHVKDFIACRRFESLTLHHILQGFSTSACEWLMPPGQAAQHQYRVSVSDALKRRELLEDFLFWYFDSFLLPLLKTTFYVTESSLKRQKVLYFRQDDWEALCAPLIDRLTSATFEKMPESEAEEILRQRRLGFSFVRLLPKETGVRPIVNLRRRKMNQRGGSDLSINQILDAAFRILTYEKQTQPRLLGASVCSANELYPRLKAFKLRLPRDSKNNLPKLYFVKVDVHACFDMIEQTKLLEILRDLISEDVYMIQRYGQVTSVAGKIRRMYAKKAIPDDEHPHFLTFAADLAGALRHTIFVDQVTYRHAKKQEILQLLEEHITENIVKIGTDYYRQMVGIPQGSVLSSLLCSFFYGDLEKRFGKFMDDPESVLLRWTDDYLFITTSLPRATSFLDMMNKGHPEYGCFISKDKTVTNLDDAEPQQQPFTWAGYRINVADLSVSADYSKYQTDGAHLRNSLTVERGRRPGATFLHRMLQQAKARSHIIYCDTGLNTEDTVHLNIYQNFLMSAMKMHGYIQDWGIDAKKNTAFIQNTVQQMINYTYAAIRNKASNKVSKASLGRCKVQKVAVIWLGTHAFHTVLSRKPVKYSSLLKSLGFELSRHRRFRDRFRSLVEEGWAELQTIPF